MNVTTPLDSLGTAGICIAVVAFIVIMTIRGMRTEARKQAFPTRSAEWKPPTSWKSHLQYLGGYGPSKAHELMCVHQRNEFRRHCRIGKIILKERV